MIRLEPSTGRAIGRCSITDDPERLLQIQVTDVKPAALQMSQRAEQEISSACMPLPNKMAGTRRKECKSVNPKKSFSNTVQQVKEIKEDRD
jgi:hypothetical protein